MGCTRSKAYAENRTRCSETETNTQTPQVVKAVFTDPANAVLTVARVKDYLRITDTNSDTLLGEILLAATRDVMGYTKRSIASRTVTLYVDSSEIKGNRLHLPHGPVTALGGLGLWAGTCRPGRPWRPGHDTPRHGPARPVR